MGMVDAKYLSQFNHFCLRKKPLPGPIIN